ncbi:hypothetical protein ERO13_A05G000100v2 [Gossypium hirsutum]|uniref:Uncharacterized protein n=1 Tax=Gossypium hirsutum TaxID=3635 RepID=A0A1U8J782_GOSHI|nr:uncharacterized protein LOC107902884 [Gossypium hirsutum]KAG4197055.1 hypothetical protein ERO13_A05G000100v2 [Gossypium hirsutum]
MGNCLVVEEKVIGIMEPDGKILEYQALVKVEQVLSNFSGHTLSDSFLGFHHLQPDAKLISGQLYYLIPLPSPSKKHKKRKVRFSNPEVNDDQVRSPNVVRIKLIISKQELQELLQNGGVSAQDIASHNIQSKQTTNGIIAPDVDDDSCRVSKPVLQTIAEVK